jgi:trk system potassium uptake protein TrkA
VTVVCVKHPGDTFTYAESSTVVREGDLLVVAGVPDDVDRFVRVG